ncbi:adhesive plaque matrix protein-like [Dermacentor silvarum]|uniref:adhesive plaque matrix protein-like n=1 Tax=Dermacentor silvarum TaxID=543639 RepID=UPI001897E946|nr:adhesive plaque matrix protein-like [Dermacentor silvarum]
MIGIPALFLLSLASSVLGGDYHTTVTETAAPVSVSHADSNAAGTTDHAALTSVHSNVHADVHAVTTGSATVGSVQAAPSVASFHGDSTMTAVHGYPGVTSFHDAAAPHTLYAAPVVNAVHTSVSGIPAAVSAVHESSAAVTNAHAAPAVATPAVGTLHTSVEGASAVGTVHASPTATTAVPGAPAVTMVHSSPAGVSKVDTTSAYPAPTVTAYQDGSPYPAYYNPQFAYSPYYQPFPFVNGGAASASKMTYQSPYGQSAYQPAAVDSGYYQPSPYFGYVPGFGRPSAYPTATVFPAYPASPAANAYQTGSAMTPAQNAPSVTKATMVGSYPSSHVVSTMFHDAAPSVAGDHHAMPAVATTSTTYQTNPGVTPVHSTQGIATVHSTPATGTTSATYQATPEVGSVHTGPAVATTYQAADHAFSNVQQTPAVSPFPAFPFYQTVPVADQTTKVDSYQTSPAVGAVHSSAPALTSVHESAPATATLHSADPKP